MSNKGKFQKGNQAALKPKLCPHCNKEIEVKVYTFLAKKIKLNRLKTESIENNEVYDNEDN